MHRLLSVAILLLASALAASMLPGVAQAQFVNAPKRVEISNTPSVEIVTNPVNIEGRVTVLEVISPVPCTVEPNSLTPLLAPECQESPGRYYSNVGTTPVQITLVDGGLANPNQVVILNEGNVAGCCDKRQSDGGLPDCTTRGRTLPPNYGTNTFQGLNGAQPVFCRARNGVISTLNVVEGTCSAPTP